jgi:hypothetical protein
MDAIDRYVQEAGGLKPFWERLARLEAEQRQRVEEKRDEQEQLMRELGA